MDTNTFSTISPYLDLLNDCITQGWADWEDFGKRLPHYQVDCSARTRASFVYDRIRKRAEMRFSERPNVKILEKRGFLELDIRGKLLIRFKKLDKMGRASNVLTKQQVGMVRVYDST